MSTGGSNTDLQPTNKSVEMDYDNGVHWKEVVDI